MGALISLFEQTMKLLNIHFHHFTKLMFNKIFFLGLVSEKCKITRKLQRGRGGGFSINFEKISLAMEVLNFLKVAY